jgi:large subunit ribosomal protein L6
MSRIGRRKIELPDDVELDVSGRQVTVSGPNGEVTRQLTDRVEVQIDDGTVEITRNGEAREDRSHQGLIRSRISNMVRGVSDGFKRELEINGIGYRAEQRGEYIQLELGFSHPVLFELPEVVDVEIEEETELTLTSSDQELLGQVAAKIRNLRPPEPYKGKGVKYKDETIRRKVGKAAAGSGSAA